MYIEESEAEMYKIGYINSKSKLKTRDLPEIYTGGDLNDGDFVVHQLTDKNIVRVARHLMDKTYHNALVYVVKVDGDEVTNIYKAHNDFKLELDYKASNGNTVTVEIPGGAYIEGKYLTHDNSLETAHALADRWGNGLLKAKLQKMDGDIKLYDYRDENIPLHKDPSQVYSNELADALYEKHHFKRDNPYIDNMVNQKEHQLVVKLAEQNILPNESYRNFKERLKYFYDMYKNAVDFKTITHITTGQKVDIPISKSEKDKNFFTYNKHVKELLLCNGFDDINHQHLSVDGMTIQPRPVDVIYVDKQYSLDNIKYENIAKHSGSVVISGKDLNKKMFDNLRNLFRNKTTDKDNYSLENDKKIGISWYKDFAKTNGETCDGVVVNISTNSRNARYVISKDSENYTIVNKDWHSDALDMPSVRKVLNTIAEANKQQLLPQIENQPLIESPKVEKLDAPIVNVALPQSLTTRINEIKILSDSISNKIGENIIEKELLNAKNSRVETAVNQFNELHKLNPTKAADYVPRFEEALDNVKTEMENKIEQLSEKDGNDFEIALRMLENNDLML